LEGTSVSHVAGSVGVPFTERLFLSRLSSSLYLHPTINIGFEATKISQKDSGCRRARTYDQNMPTAIENTRAQRLSSFRRVQEFIAYYRGIKLHEAEAEVIEHAAEDLLLAIDCEDEAVASAITAFVTLVDDLEESRWAEMVGDDEHPGPSSLMRASFLACAPGTVD
jgi:hypothetical protein